MRYAVLVATCLSLAACSQKTEETHDHLVTAYDTVPSPPPADTVGMASDASSSRAPSAMIAPGGIGITAAPGVAFAYHYAFRMPADAIAKAQEVHAQACEKLGTARCRITGMRYRLLGENNVEAMLAFKLDPTLAREFGKDGIASIVAAAGKLVDAEITGSDAGAAIKRLDVRHTRNDDEMHRLDALLANSKLARGEREELQRQRAALVQGNAAVKDDAADQQESLATTPMVFDYGSGPAVRGFDPSAPIRSAADTAIASIQITLAVLLGALALLGPPALVVIAGLLLWRRFRPRGTIKPEGTDARS